MNFWNIMHFDGQAFRCKSLLKSIHSSLTISIFLYSSLFIQRFFHGSNDLLWTKSSTQYKNIGERASRNASWFWTYILTASDESWAIGKHKDDMRNGTWHMRFKFKYKFLMTNGNRLPLWIKWPKINVRCICHTTPTHPNKNSNQQFTSNYNTFLTTPSLSVHEMLVLYISEFSQVSPTQRPEALAWFRGNEFLNLGRELHEHFNYALSIYRP